MEKTEAQKAFEAVNYRQVALPDCCAVCRFVGRDFDGIDFCHLIPVYTHSVSVNGLCDKFLRAEAIENANKVDLSAFVENA